MLIVLYKRRLFHPTNQHWSQISHFLPFQNSGPRWCGRGKVQSGLTLQQNHWKSSNADDIIFIRYLQIGVFNYVNLPKIISTQNQHNLTHPAQKNQIITGLVQRQQCWCLHFLPSSSSTQRNVSNQFWDQKLSLDEPSIDDLLIIINYCLVMYSKNI